MDYQSWMRYRGCAETTIEQRARIVARARDELGRLDRVQAAKVADWLMGWEHPTTRATYLSALRSWWRWRGVVDPMREQPAIRRPVSVPRPVPLDVVRAAIDASDGHVRIWISLMAYAGLRGMEVAATGPAHLDGQRLYLPRCKGGGDGMAHLPLWLADELRQTRAWHVDTAHVRRCVRQALRQAGSNATPHALRHTYGTAMLRATGGDLRETQTAMRHKSVSSTQIYTLVDGLRISQAADRLPR